MPPGAPGEIGIRIALGADRRGIVIGVFSRTMVQIGIGVLAGALMWFAVMHGLGIGDDLILLASSVGVLALVGLLACGIPVRRAVRIQPAEALRDAG